jgi:methyl-accepting chemotaxis protein
MERRWTFGQKLGLAFGAVVMLTLLMAGVAIYALRGVVESKDKVLAINVHNLVGAEQLRGWVERKVGSSGAFLLAKDERFFEQTRQARQSFAAVVVNLRDTVPSAEGKRLLAEIERTEAEHEQALDQLIAMRRRDLPSDQLVRVFDSELSPRRERLDQAIRDFVAREEKVLLDQQQAATDRASATVGALVGISALVLLLAGAIAWVLTRTLSRQVGSAVQHVQSSSTELQSTASQQATGAKQTATAMAEVSTTISELLATSRQIAESAQRVAHMAEESATAARKGELTVAQAQEAITGIRRQVDAVVTHMLELGRKSQQIGGILDIINELAEQTNILAINATIEAAGAGDSGRRFAVVGDEIRKLADRVGSSAREIRTLIDEIRGAVNTTVMATEGGSKAVDAGTRHFGELAAQFKQIVNVVETTTAAAREIELSTKQQSTAVEQVNQAIGGVAQATRESEASSGQTLQTATQLSSLSRELARLIQSPAAA